MKQHPSIDWIVPGDPGQRTGGYLFDARIVAGLRARGWPIRVHGLDGAFPRADHHARQAMTRVLNELPHQHAVIIDGLALGGLPDVAQTHSQRLRLLALVHHPLADEELFHAGTHADLLDSERQALSACRAVAVTSQFSARRLAELALFDDQVTVIEPGVQAAPLAASAADLAGDGQLDRPARWLCVASLTPRKGHAVLLDALADLPGHWQLTIVGSPDRDPGHAAALLERTEQLGLGSRIDWVGERSDAELARDYAAADLCLLPSYYEGYGMVVTEALARGLALVSTTGGALADTLPARAALRVDPGDAGQLNAALSSWLNSAALRRQLAEGAIAQRHQLTGWSEAVARFETWLSKSLGSP